MITEEIVIVERFKEWKDSYNKNIKYYYNNQLSYDKNKQLCINLTIQHKHYGRLINSVKKVVQGYSKILLVQGRGGIGKSHSIKKVLVKEDANYFELSGDLTEAHLYRTLFENNGKIIWLKDAVKILTFQGSLNLLKAATESEDVCKLTKHNYSNKQDDLPDEFECSCRFIFDFNTINSPSLKADMDALVTRGDFIRLNMSNNDIIEIMKTICKSSDDINVTEFLIKELKDKPYADINLRTQYKAIRTFNFCKQNKLNWKKEIRQSLFNVSKNIELLYPIIGNKSMRLIKLKQNILKKGVLSTISKTNKLIEKMLFLNELKKVSAEDRNYLVKLNKK